MTKLILPGSGPTVISPIDISEASITDLSDVAGWLAFVPTLTASTTNPTLGTGSIRDGRYLYIEGLNLVVYRFFIQFGTSGVNEGSGEYKVSVPHTISSNSPSNSTFSLGSIVAFDWSTSGHRITGSIGRDFDGNNLQFETNGGAVWHNSPFTWAADDRFGGTAVYQAA